MRTIERKQWETLRSVPPFLDEHRDVLAAVATSPMRRRLDDTLARLAFLADEQTASAAGARVCTQRYRERRRQLVRDHLVPLALIARTTEPPLSALEPFHLPRGRSTAQRLATVARAMAETAASHADILTAAGLPDDFVNRMGGAADAMMAELGRRTQESARHRIATEAIRTLLAAARRIVSVLDAFVKTACEQDAGLLAGWASVTHVRRGSRRAMASPAVGAQEPFQLIVASVPVVRDGARLQQPSNGSAPTALRHRMRALLAVRGRTRFAVEA